MVCNKLFRKQIIGDNKVVFPYGLRYEDVEFFYKLVPNINKISVINKSFYNYMQRESSIANVQNEKTADIFTILENINKFYLENGIYEKYKNELEYLHIRLLLGSSFLRIIKIQDKHIRKKLLDKSLEVLNLKFPKWKKNNILKNQKTKKDLYYKSVNNITYKVYKKIFRIFK